MELTKEQLEMLSDCVLSEMERVNYAISGHKDKNIQKLLKDVMDKLNKPNHIICNQLGEVNKMKVFYFNTGVRPWINSYLAKGDKFINDQRHIPFYCANVPKGSTLAFLCDNPDMKKEQPYLIKRKVYKGNMLSRFAYFNKPFIN